MGIFERRQRRKQSPGQQNPLIPAPSEQEQVEAPVIDSTLAELDDVLQDTQEERYDSACGCWR
jgi:hypothetical protein